MSGPSGLVIQAYASLCRMMGTVTVETEIEERGSFSNALCRVCGWRGPPRRSRRVAARSGFSWDPGLPRPDARRTLTRHPAVVFPLCTELAGTRVRTAELWRASVQADRRVADARRAEMRRFSAGRPPATGAST